MPAVKTGMTDVAGYFCSDIGTVSQAVPAAMSQVHQRHIRTGLKYKKWAGNQTAGISFSFMCRPFSNGL